MISTIHAPEILTNSSQKSINDIKGKGKAKVKETESITIIDDKGDELFYRNYKDEQTDLEYMMKLVEQELSEPYNVYTFRYFLIDWPHLAFLVFPSSISKEPIATIICKQDSHRGKTNRGYIAMLSVDRAWRRRGIASKLIKVAIDEMIRRGVHEVVLETEFDNAPSLALYDRLGFLREKRLHRFYSNGKDAFRLILPLETDPPPPFETDEEAEQGRWSVGAGSEPGPGMELGVINEEGPLRYFEETDVNMGDTPKLPPRPLDDWGMYT
ncbi:uncharacterized protein I206_101185 [Kwoniella pini CBS 10737]|uniref:Peptide alpha-N-acetyltransferase n=1 Tax=Kwoniella pini CBS 10737 TaxID=1296096 RepID=A0A1B9IB03_9TREE|nr:peptide alpha-N-acetyltransferase [Kwoniella pini CBS 10737]OCF52842.1 peptide alpha-N-acetyltransferase [Kwoniella pini CBS 10737]